MLSTVMSGELYICSIQLYKHSVVQAIYMGGNIGLQAFGQPCSQPVGLWGSRGFHGELLCLTERQHLQKC